MKLPLVMSQPLRTGLPCNLKVHSIVGQPIRVDISVPSGDDLSILLHKMRPFILEREPASFLKVAACLGRNIDNQIFRDFLRGKRELYNGREFQSQVRISSGNDFLNCERILSDWLNAFEYHRDEEKQKKIGLLIDSTPGELLKFLVVSMLFDKLKAIEQIAAMVSVLLGHTNSVRFSASEPKSEK